MKKPKAKKPAKPKAKKPGKKPAKPPAGKKPHHLTLAQRRRRQQARIRSLRHQLHLARRPLKPAPKPKKPHKPRGLALGEAVPCCAAEALAASLRLAGWPVGDADVLALHEAAGGTADVAVSILAVLEAASASGLAGVRPRWFRPLEPGWDAGGRGDERRRHLVEGGQGRPDQLPGDSGPVHGLILGLELPGAHAVTLAPGGSWLSWGDTYDPADWPDAVIEEVWEVVWP